MNHRDGAVVVTGMSDDLIELDGAVSEEFDIGNGGSGLVAFSNGVLLRVAFDDDGIWRITPLFGADKVSVAQADADGRTDAATVAGPVRWAAHVQAWAAAPK